MPRSEIAGIMDPEERNFRKYEGLIKLFLDHYPETLTVKPKDVGLNYFLTRLRMAISHLLTRRWETEIDIEKLSELRPKFNITASFQDGTVSLTCRSYSQKSIGFVPTTRKAGINQIFAFEGTLNLSGLHAYLNLLNQNNLVHPIKVLASTPEIYDYLTSTKPNEEYPNITINHSPLEDAFIIL